jgi:2,5-diketo-D-gluconate reductase A
LFRETEVVPAVNQIQVSPSIPRPAARAYNERHGIITESYSPLGASSDLLNAPVLASIGGKYGKTPGQVVLRWHVQQGLVAIPKTASPERMQENLDVFDFELDQEDLSKLQTLDAGPDAGVDSDVQGH